MRKRSGWVISLLALLAACSPGEDARVSRNPANRKPEYFNMLGFLQQQAEQLNNRKPTVEKHVLLRDGRQEVARITQTDWVKELQIFQQADINKPALRGLYLVDSTTTPEGLTRRTFRRQAGTDHPVTQLVVLTDGTSVQQLTAMVAQDNPLVYSAKTLELRCQNGQLTSYRVQGVQKLVLFDSVRYAVRGKVL